MSDLFELIGTMYVGAVDVVSALIPRSSRKSAAHPLRLYNTMSGAIELFKPLRKDAVKMYNCGPTVYGRQHIGNLSMFIFTDTLRKVLLYNHFTVKQVINFTDFGHLSSDNDEGEDKMTKGLKREGMALSIENMRVLGEKYANIFLEDLRQLNVDVDHVTFPRASDFVSEQIAMIRTLEEKGYTYQSHGCVYFDTSLLPDYGKLGNINLEGLISGARVKDSHKKHPTDFLLWKASRRVGWMSPWGKGFPGWHIECSAMIRATLGTQIDIHTGGIEHIPIHHNNEIAQSESATGKKPFAQYWLHRAHIQLEGSKIAKSGGNVIYLSDVIERGFHPLALRYLFLTAHYRTPSNFTWEALGAAQTAFAKLVGFRLSLADSEKDAVSTHWRSAFVSRLNDDLETPAAIAVVWEMVSDKLLSSAQKLATLLDFDSVLGLNLAEPDEHALRLAREHTREEVVAGDLPDAIAHLVREREEARDAKDWSRADELRIRIQSEGYALEDKDGATKILKI